MNAAGIETAIAVITRLAKFFAAVFALVVTVACVSFAMWAAVEMRHLVASFASLPARRGPLGNLLGGQRLSLAPLDVAIILRSVLVEPQALTYFVLSLRVAG